MDIPSPPEEFSDGEREAYLLGAYVALQGAAREQAAAAETVKKEAFGDDTDDGEDDEESEACPSCGGTDTVESFGGLTCRSCGHQFTSSDT